MKSPRSRRLGQQQSQKAGPPWPLIGVVVAALVAGGLFAATRSDGAGKAINAAVRSLPGSYKVVEIRNGTIETRLNFEGCALTITKSTMEWAATKTAEASASPYQDIGDGRIKVGLVGIWVYSWEGANLTLHRPDKGYTLVLAPR